MENNDAVAEDLQLMDKDVEAKQERFAYLMFKLIGIILFAVGVGRTFAGDLAVTIPNLIMIGLGLVFLASTFYFSSKQNLSDRQLEHFKREEEDEFEAGTESYRFKTKNEIKNMDTQTADWREDE